MSERKKINDGGSAFPVDASIRRGMGCDGMSLRDWFAGQVAPRVMESIMALAMDEYSQLAASKAARNSKELIAIMSYELADAMILMRDGGAA